MPSNFTYLKKEPKYHPIMEACIEAEQALAVSCSAAALQARRALEIAVKWAYQYDADLTVPYRDNLSSLVNDLSFLDVLDAKLSPRIRYIIKLGNKAAHTARAVTPAQAEQALRDLHAFISWIDFSYSVHADNIPFVRGYLPDGSEEKKTRKMQQELAAKEAAWQEEKQQLQQQLQDETERRKNAEQRRHNHGAGDFACDDITEFETRRLYIDLALELAGWQLGGTCRTEVEVQGMPTPTGTGFADYVLYADNGRPLAVVEAKRTSENPHKGRQQAQLYADCLAAEHGLNEAQKPLVFYTNGFAIWFLDGDCPERLVAGFFTQKELAWQLQRREQRTPMTTVKINDAITNRPYQKMAIRAVCDTFAARRRKALLVMATGSGKTRVAVSIVDVLQRHHRVKNILFLADRVELVKQARKSFVALLPNLSTCNLLDNRDDPQSRMVFSTYPTMMNAIDSTKRADGTPLFTPGHFDLIILDESHRSIYKKYHDLFTWFDGCLLGLTATPKSDLEKNTYSVFELEDGVPTFAYELAEAVAEGYLVPYHTLETTMKFMEEGIHYDQLSAEEQEQWEETFDDGVEEVPGSALNRFLFNADTVDHVLEMLMEKGIHVAGGDRLGKSIIFAANTKHADFIRQRFNLLYPHLAGRDAATIYNGIRYVDKVIEEFSDRDRPPQIAISVDMLDTGIDIPEIVNLVLFKKVRSKAKFWQMLGRGTRLCEELFGPGQDKEEFLVFDCCSNFEFFRADPQEVEGRIEKSLTERLFTVQVRLVRRLQHADFQDEAHTAHRQQLVRALHGEVNTIDESHFTARMQVKYLHRYRREEPWQDISEVMGEELEKHVAPLLPARQGSELAKRFDHLLYTIELATLQGEPAPRPREKVVKTAVRLAEKGHLAQIKAHAQLIAEVQTAEFWKQATIFELERVRLALRELLVLLEKESTVIYYTDFGDTVVEVKENQGFYGGGEFESYRLKVNAWLKAHQDDLVVHKLRHNQPLTESDFHHMEKVLWVELGSEEEYHRDFGDEPLLGLVARLVGLERRAADAIFSEFIGDESLNARQMEFVQLIVNHVVENGGLEKKLLNDHPFNRHGILIELFAGKLEVVQGLVKKIDEVNGRWEVDAA